mmetsp:Transcript_11802/g.14717  ORF Transcript_11802/g.14717 Transcript_11802/m.14717 type:complete len:103 (-) Transcript_11802:96-404(-)|eukprot:CAMPEP_0172507300 /NCGR_PEP_ID=MMETSP1066-20121228/202764_1 /TAXON_ID=671091 /ORGANISM="Coscinodiscus wailesii, Strain CCMP2513" /LENGTH=102 /DNA_ID=CAMNT_0013284803 /DNA_START=229 /DNA_END=537 /DNA_ORIENTATION=-
MSYNKNAMFYIRCKRRNQTFFIHVEGSSTFHSVKNQISLAVGGSTPPEDIKIYLPQKTAEEDLPDDGTVSDHEVGNDAVLNVVFKDGEVWEDLEVEDIGVVE